MIKRPIFQDNLLQEEFNNEGIVKLNFASQSIIKELKETFYSFHPTIDARMHGGYYFSIFGQGKRYMTEIREKFSPIIQPLLDTYFVNYKVLSIILQIKGTAENSHVGIHQDLTTVDEQNYHASTVWIPLNPSIELNGGVRFLKGSQNVFRGFRAHTADHYQFQELEDFIYKNSISYPTELGQALVFDPGTIHFSPPNFSNEPRLSIAVSIVHDEAPIIMGYVDKENDPLTMEVYDVPDDFYYRYTDFELERHLRPDFGTLKEKRKDAVVLSYPKRYFQKVYLKSRQSKTKAFRSFLKRTIQSLVHR
jgi:hypothetical protein